MRKRHSLVEERPGGELARFGAADIDITFCAGSDDAVDDALQQDGVARQLQFRRILAGVGVGSRKEQRDGRNTQIVQLEPGAECPTAPEAIRKVVAAGVCLFGRDLQARLKQGECLIAADADDAPRRMTRR